MCFIVFFFEDITDNLNFLYFFYITLTPGERNNDWLPAQEQKESVGWVSRQDDYDGEILSLYPEDVWSKLSGNSRVPRQVCGGDKAGGIYVHHVGVLLESCPDGRRKRASRFAR